MFNVERTLYRPISAHAPIFIFSTKPIYESTTTAALVSRSNDFTCILLQWIKVDNRLELSLWSVKITCQCNLRSGHESSVAELHVLDYSLRFVETLWALWLRTLTPRNVSTSSNIVLFWTVIFVIECFVKIIRFDTRLFLLYFLFILNNFRFTTFPGFKKTLDFSYKSLNLKLINFYIKSPKKYLRIWKRCKE